MTGVIVFTTLLAAALANIGAFALVWLLRRNRAEVDPLLKLETWTAVSDGTHNSNSHMVYWRGEFWLIHASSPYHFSTPKSKLVLLRSPDAIGWQKVREFKIPGEDIRDPKLSVIGGRLHLYVLKSVSFRALPYMTAHTSSDDGENWNPLEDLHEHEGWIFWNPRTQDGIHWYAPAYWHEYGESTLFVTHDGDTFTRVSSIHRGGRGKDGDLTDETDIAFLDDGTMISTQRLEYSDRLCGDPRACTNLTKAMNPYTSWEEIGKDYSTRLDGPTLFSLNGKVYALGRRNPYIPKGPFRYYGSIFAKKRTALFEVTDYGLIFLSDLPSSGDTSYGAVVVRDGSLYGCYYTSSVSRDWPWIIGMISPSEIRIFKFSESSLITLSEQKCLICKSNRSSTFIPAFHNNGLNSD